MRTIRHATGRARVVPAVLSFIALGAVAACESGTDDAGTSRPAAGSEPTSAPVTSAQPAPGASGPAAGGTPTAPVGATPPPAGWVDARADPGVFGPATVTDALVVDGRLVAVGCRSEGAAGDLPIWTTTDATGRQPVAGPEVVAGDTALDCLTDVVATPAGLFTHGRALLRSVDGTAWQEAPILGPPNQQLGSVDAVLPLAGGVAVLRVGFWPPPRWLTTTPVQVLTAPAAAG